MISEDGTQIVEREAATSPVSAVEAIEKAMEGVTPGPWELHYEIDGPITQTRIKSGRKALATTAAQCGRPHHQNEQVANAAYIAACSPDRMREVLALARQAEALQRENAELREALTKMVGIAWSVKSFCRNNSCGEYGTECPIQMGEWWETSDEEALSRTRALLGGSENAE